jgi:hypothetical protein
MTQIQSTSILHQKKKLNPHQDPTQTHKKKTIKLQFTCDSRKLISILHNLPFFSHAFGFVANFFMTLQFLPSQLCNARKTNGTAAAAACESEI